MDEDSLAGRIARAAPSAEWSAEADAAIGEMWRHVHDFDAQPTRSRRYGRGQLAAAVAAAALVGGLVTAGAPVIDEALNPDVVIGVEYVTQQGDRVECSIRVSGGSVVDPDSTVVAKSLRELDFTDIGPRIHERALQLAAETSGVEMGDVDAWAWSFAETELTVGQVQPHLPSGEYSVMSSSCPRTL